MTESPVRIPSPELNSQPASHSRALIILSCVYFIWGLTASLNDVLIPHLKSAFALNYTQAILIQFCFFMAYLFVSIPAGRLIQRLGYQRGVVIGLALASTGAFLFYPAAVSRLYEFFLGAIFIMATGIVFLQASANPFVAHLGTPETSSSRLTLTQAFNSLGTTVSPFFGAALILSVTVAGASLGDGSAATSVILPYLMISATLLTLAIIVARAELPKVEPPRPAGENKGKHVLSERHLRLGAVGIFVYVGAEVSIGSFIVNYLGLENIAGMEESRAARYLAVYWGGALIGRFVGGLVMRHVRPGRLMVLNAISAIILLSAVAFSSGGLAMWSVLLIGLCNSIMFPTIFSLAIKGLEGRTAQGSAVLCLAIIGGAIVPLLQGMLADLAGLQLSFVLPIACYAFIAYYGLSGSHPGHKHV